MRTPRAAAQIPAGSSTGTVTTSEFGGSGGPGWTRSTRGARLILYEWAAPFDLRRRASFAMRWGVLSVRSNGSVWRSAISAARAAGGAAAATTAIRVVE